MGTADEDTWVRRATLKAKPDYTYFQPKCISYRRATTPTGTGGRDHDGNVAEHIPTLGQSCAFDRIVNTTVPGCPAICRGMRIRALEARGAPHFDCERPLPRTRRPATARATAPLRT